MGLLDDAIRDHLELKRRRGADPTEIAREEREALEPVFPDEPRPAGFDGEPQAARVLDGEPPQGDPLARTRPGAAEAPPDPVAAQSFGEETAELDMQAVLAEDVPSSTSAAAGDTARPVPPVPPASVAPRSRCAHRRRAKRICWSGRCRIARTRSRRPSRCRARNR